MKIKLFKGDWCPMCRRDVPKILNSLASVVDTNDDVEIIDVNGFKTEPRELIDKHSIKRVPTLIFFDENQKELKRFTEYPETTWENDITNFKTQIILK